MLRTSFTLAAALLVVGADADIWDVATVATLAGSGSSGSDDGTGAAASFNNPMDIAYSPDGSTALVADYFNSKIRQIEVDSGAVTTLAGSGSTGSDDGTGAAASFNYPQGIAYSPDGSTALVADTGNNKIRQIEVDSGAVTTLAGSDQNGSDDGTGGAALFNGPMDIAYSPDGSTALVADYYNNKIRKIEVDSGAVTTLAGSGSSGSDDGTGAAASFNNPMGIAYSPDGSTALVGDYSNNKIRQIEVDSGAVTTLAGSGSAGSDDGTGAAASFNGPRGIAYSPDGSTALVADLSNNKIRQIEVDSGAVTTLAGSDQSGSDDGTGAAASFYYPQSIAYSPDGTAALVVDFMNHKVRMLTSAIVCTRPSDITGYTVTDTELNVATGFDVTPLCDAGFEGSPAVDACTSSGDYTLSGCTEIVCTRPSDITGYTVTDTELNVVTGFDVTPLCAAGFEGSPAVDACTSSGDYTLSGCTEIVCTRPSDITGYTVTDTELNVATGFDVTPLCDAGFEGSPAVDACTSSGDYTLSGCTEIVCTRPSDITGYTVTDTELNVVTGFDVTPLCDAGFEGSPAVDACTSSGDYTLSGCTEIVCTRPSDITGYTVTDTELNVVTGFDVTPLCDAGFEGSPAVDACTSSGDYTLSGCTEIVCTRPSDITGYTVTDTELNVATGFDVTPLCDAGFEGSPAVDACTSSGDYTLSGCTEIVCTRPSDITGYTVTDTELNVVTGFDVTPLCDAGFEGSPAVDACTSSGDYTLSGCTEIVCTRPSDITGYTVTDTELNVATGFDVTPLCDAGFEGSPAVDACTSSGDYTLSGCTEIVCTRPSDITGYTVTDTELSLPSGFVVSAECSTLYAGSASAAACTSSGPYSLEGCTFNTTTTILAVVVVMLLAALIAVLCLTRVREPHGVSSGAKADTSV